MLRFTALLFLALLSFCPRAEAVKTASSFDVNYDIASLSMTATDPKTGVIAENRTLSSSSGLEIDYNVAMFDYRTVATVSFTQFESSNVGSTPFTRFAIGASYHFFRINGQRVILDNQVESKSWGVSPALELSLGITKLSINDGQTFQTTFSLLDALPRLVIEIPASSSFLLMLKAGYYMTVNANNPQYKFSTTGMVLSAGFKLTTL